MIVLDTNVVSALMRGDPTAVQWQRSQPASSLVTTAITVAEVLYGIARLDGGRRRDELAAAADDAFRAFSGSVLAFDEAAARVYAEVVVRRERIGRPVSAADAQIAAVCRFHGAALATRNTRDFLDTGVACVDPWSA